MDVTQVYLFQGVKQLNEFIKDNCYNMTVENISFEFVPAKSGFFIFLTAKVQLMMCDEVWRRYAEVAGLEA